MGVTDIASGDHAVIGHIYNAYGWLLGQKTTTILHSINAAIAGTASGVTLVGRPSIYHAEFDNLANTSERFLDGVSKGSVAVAGDPINVDAGDRLSMGAVTNGTLKTFEWDGPLAEIIITSSIDATDRANIIAYFKAKYGIA